MEKGFNVFKRKIYDSDDIPEDISRALGRSIFITSPKNPGANEYEVHRTISLMSDITKLTTRILEKRMGSRIRSKR